LSGSRKNEWDDKGRERGPRRQTFDPGREPLLDRVERKPRHDPRHDRRKTIPQPRLEQKDEGEQDPERAEKTAHE
jgi:hypothetical protein